MQNIIFLFLCLSVYSLKANSQIEKKNWLVGGKGTFQRSNSENALTSVSSKSTYFNFSADVGYFLLDKFAMGILTGIIHSKYDELINSSATNFGIGTFARYYFLKNENRYNLFSEAAFSHDFGSNGINPINAYSIAGGAVVFFNNSVGLELIPKYSVSKSKNGTSKNILLEIGFQIHLTKD